MCVVHIKTYILLVTQKSNTQKMYQTLVQGILNRQLATGVEKKLFVVTQFYNIFLLGA